MLRKSLLGLMVVLPLCGCVTDPKFTQPVKAFKFDWPEKGVKAAFEYNTRQVVGYEYRSICAGEVTVENYGKNNFQNISFNLTFYSSSKELVANDSFYLSSGLISGGKANLPPIYSNPLDLPDGSRYFTDCPSNMDSASVQLNAF